MKISREQLEGIIRHALTTIGGILIAKGLIDDSILTEVIGGSYIITGIVWSVINKNKNYDTKN